MSRIVFTALFIVSLIFLGVFQFIDDKVTFSNFITPLAIVCFALGAFSLSLSHLVNDEVRKRTNREVIRYKRLAGQLVGAGIYFVYSYFFWLVVVNAPSLNRSVIENLVYDFLIHIFSFSTVVLVIFAIILLLVASWKLLLELDSFQ